MKALQERARDFVVIAAAQDTLNDNTDVVLYLLMLISGIPSEDERQLYQELLEMYFMNRLDKRHQMIVGASLEDQSWAFYWCSVEHAHAAYTPPLEFSL